MALTETNLTSGQANNTSAPATASVTPAANSLVLLAILIWTGDANFPSVTPTGNSLTWTLVASSPGHGSSGVQKLYLFRAQGAAPTAGAITITLGHTVDSVLWSVVSIGGTVRPSGAVINSAAPAAVTTSSVAVSLTGAMGSDSGTYGCFAQASTNAFTPGANFTELHDLADATVGDRLQTQWAPSYFASVDATGTNSISKVGIAVEIGGTRRQSGVVRPQAISRAAVR